MKKSFLFLFLFVIFLSGDNENIDIKKIMVYKSIDTSLTFNDLKEKDRFFVPLVSQSQLLDNDVVYWIKIELSKKMKSTRYMARYKGYDFVHSSLSDAQLLNKYKYTNDGSLSFSFYYHPKRDSSYLYFKIFSVTKDKPIFLLQTYNSFYKYALVKPNTHMMYLFFGLISGLMLMVSFYNIAIFLYIQENSFLYYGLMQFCLIFVLMYTLGIFSMGMFSFYTLALFSSLWGILFIRSFFNIKNFFPKIEMVLKFYILLIILDFIFLCINNYSLLSQYGLFSLFGSIALLVAYLRLRKGFTPAKFFLIGWILLGISIFITEHLGLLFGLSPLLFGPPLEAIFLAIALASKLKLFLDEKREQQELLIHQNRLASMGEMIGNISHQWKQPLTYLSFNFMNLREASKRNLLDHAYLNNKLDKADAQLDFMSQTIDNFKDFYLPNKVKEMFSVKEASLETLEIMHYQFEEQNIKIILIVTEDIVLESYKNEYKQVLLNLLTNAKDIFDQRVVINPTITITIEKNSVSILDNGGGIEPTCIKRIFDPYFSTKKENSGIGLYMSKMIIERDMDGVLEVSNFNGGALFKIMV